jgi:hypothetical protein
MTAVTRLPVQYRRGPNRLMQDVLEAIRAERMTDDELARAVIIEQEPSPLLFELLNRFYPEWVKEDL